MCGMERDLFAYFSTQQLFQVHPLYHNNKELSHTNAYIQRIGVPVYIHGPSITLSSVKLHDTLARSGLRCIT